MVAGDHALGCAYGGTLDGAYAALLQFEAPFTVPLTDFMSWPTFLSIGPPGHLTPRLREGRSSYALRAGVRSNGVGDQEEARAFAEGARRRS